MTTSTLYGRIVTGGQIRNALQETLEAWLPAYLVEVARQTGLTLPKVRHYSAGIDPETPVEELPAVSLTAPGVDGSLEQRGAFYDAPWGIGAGILVAHPLVDVAFEWASAYVAAIRACVVQHGSLGGLASSTRWNDEEIDQVDWNTEWAVFGGLAYFTTHIPGLVDASAGPAVPPSPDVTVPLQTIEVASTQVLTSHLP